MGGLLGGDRSRSVLGIVRRALDVQHTVELFVETF